MGIEFDKKALRREIEKIATTDLNSRTYDIECPHCNAEINAPAGESECPFCHNTVNLTLDINFNG